MKRNRKLGLMLASAVSMALGGAGGSAYAQNRIGSDGHALDASNRIGSNGMNWNNPSQSISANQLQNGIVTGNVTGGREFRGRVSSMDPKAFRGPTVGGISDQFIRSSSGAPYGGMSQNNAQTVQPIYGVSRAAPPPAGYTSQGIASGAQVLAPLPTRQVGDLRMGQVYNTSTSALPEPGQLLMPGPVDPNTQTTTLITASPLYGVRQWNPDLASDHAFLNSNMTNANALGNKIDPLTLQKMRDELLSPQLPDTGMINQDVNANKNDQQDQNDSNPNGGGRGGRSRSQGLNGALPGPFESPQNNALNSSLQGNAALGNGQLSGGLNTGAGVQQRLLSARQQSSQYAELAKRLEQYDMVQASSQAQEQGQYNRDVQDKQRRDTAARNGGRGSPLSPIPTVRPPGPAQNGAQTTPGAPARRGALPGQTVPADPNSRQQVGPNSIPLPGSTVPPDPNSRQIPPSNNSALPGAPGAPTPGTTINPLPPLPAPANNANNGATAQPQQRPAPLMIRSLAEGVQAKGLSDLLKEAETQMQQAHYSAALDEYDLAEQIAPNNPLIMLGRANVELAQPYYPRAAAHLRDAFLKDQALTLAQVDLRSWIGNERLQFLIPDLRALATREAKDPRPVFLLAYIDYNTGNERRAAAYLDLAERRADGKDELYPLLKKYWALPQDAAPADLNK